jgi:hypothetical protein
MATFQVTVPDTITLGRNGAIGSLQVDWSRVPQHVLDHIAAVYFPQCLTDAANTGGRDKGAADRLARAQKKLENMYAGQIRTRGEAAEPTDPVDLEAWRMAKERCAIIARESAEWSNCPKSVRGDARTLWVLNARAEARDEDITDRDLDHYIQHVLEVKPEIRKSAERIVRERAKAADGINL